MQSQQLKKLFCLCAALVVSVSIGCGDVDEPVNLGDDGNCPVEICGDAVYDDGKVDAWDNANDPRRFGNDFVYNWEQLKTPELQSGASEIVPWPDTYWPMTEDGYNDRWNGDNLSPVELYDAAFNAWQIPENFTELQPYHGHGMAWDSAYYDVIGPATKWAHERGGLGRAREIHNPDGSFTESIDADGDGVVDRDLNGDGEMDNGDDEGGLEGWYGHCHAWAPAAFSHVEPVHAVTINNQTFQVADIKALIEATHEGCGGTLFLGGRCNLREIERDEYGRIVDAQSECRDTNAGAWHVTIVNVMGRLKRSFVADVTVGYQVWNHPGRDYTISRQDEVTETEALALLGRDDIQEYPYNDDATRWVHVEMRFRYIVEGSASATPQLPQIDSYTSSRNYEYLLELDDNGNIIGGEWISTNQPDFLWMPSGNCDARDGWTTVISAANVQTLIDLATSTEPAPVEGDEHAFDSEPGLDIPDNDNTGISDTIVIEDGLTIAGLRVNTSISHTYIGDLMVTLEHEGTVVTLHDRAGGGQDNLVASFDVADFNGQSAAGQWTLRVTDNAGVDTGTLENWRITVITESE